MYRNSAMEKSLKACINPECEYYGINKLPFEAKYCPKCGKAIMDNKCTQNIVVDKISYALGMSIAVNIASSGVNSLNPDDFIAGIKAVFCNDIP